MIRLNEFRFIPACAGNTSSFANPWPQMPVHPRMRGEHQMPFNTRRMPGGSSPHARGTRRLSFPELPVRRFIPACAGNTHRPGTAHTVRTVHPRMRGEHMVSGSYVRHCCGSSPHARGTRVVKRQRAPCRRFIPACAGNTPPPALFVHPLPVHPRMRGEHTSTSWRTCVRRGSSPHARGTLPRPRLSPP